MDLIIFNLAGFIVIALIIYWFWIAKPKALKTSGQTITVLVKNGVYSPARIEIEAGTPVKLSFLREDPSPCAEKVIFASLNISEDLPINKEKMIELEIKQPGEYEFTCQMQMYRGSLIVK